MWADLAYPICFTFLKSPNAYISSVFLQCPQLLVWFHQQCTPPTILPSSVPSQASCLAHQDLFLHKASTLPWDSPPQGLWIMCSSTQMLWQLRTFMRQQPDCCSWVWSGPETYHLSCSCHSVTRPSSWKNLGVSCLYLVQPSGLSL